MPTLCIPPAQQQPKLHHSAQRTPQQTACHPRRTTTTTTTTPPFFQALTCKRWSVRMSFFRRDYDRHTRKDVNMTTASYSRNRHPIILGPSLDSAADTSSQQPGDALIAVKYNFKPPSIAKSAPGYLRCPTKNNAEWILEYASTSGSGSGQGLSAQGFVGAQSQARNVDCILVWDEEQKAYVLDRLASTLSMKYDRNYNKLSTEAQDAFSTSAGSGSTLKVGKRSGAPDDPSYDEDDFARQLEEGLAQVEEEAGSTHVDRDSTDAKTKRQKTGVGLGLVGTALGHQLDGITPRASPLIDRPSKVAGSAAFQQVEAPQKPVGAAMTPTSTTQARIGHTISPASATNSPRLAPVPHETSLSSTWKPPAQRAAVAITFDDDDDDDEDDEDDEEEDDEDEEDNEEDDDLEAFARQLEGSLQDSTPAEAAPSSGTQASGTSRVRRASARGPR